MRRLLVLSAVLGTFWASTAHAMTVPPDGNPNPAVYNETLQTEHFLVHYTGDKDLANEWTIRQWVGEFAANAEHAYTTFLSWNLEAPIDDGDGLIDVWVGDLSANGVEVAAFATGAGDYLPGWIAIDADEENVRDPHLAATGVQYLISFATYAAMPDWIAYATSQWGAHRLYDYTADANVHEPDNSADCLGLGCGLNWPESAGDTRWPFWQYLGERFGQDVVRQILDRIHTTASPSYDGDDAIRDVLADKGASLTDVVNDYSVATLTGNFQAANLKGLVPKLHTSAETPVETGSLDTMRVAVNRLAARFVELVPPAPTEKACYAATLSLTVTLPAGVTSRPHVYATGTKTLTALAVSGTTATASIPWDTCSNEAPAYVSLPNTSQTLDGRMFVVNAAVTVDTTKTVSPKTPPPGVVVNGPVIAAPTEDPAPTLSFYSRRLLKVASNARVLRFVLFSTGAGKIRVTFNGQTVGVVPLRAGANTAAVRLPKPAIRYSLARRAVLELTALSPAGAPGASVVQRVALTKPKPKPKRSGR